MIALVLCSKRSTIWSMSLLGFRSRSRTDPPGGCGESMASGSLSPVASTIRRVIILGIIALVVAWLAHVSILWTIGGILIVVGVLLAIVSAVGHPVGGRRHWY